MDKPTAKRTLGGGSSSRDSYRDDPDAVSLHTTPDDYDYTDAAGPSTPDTEDDQLPSYSDSALDASVTSAPEQPPVHRPITSHTDAERAATVSYINEEWSGVSVYEPGGANGLRVMRFGKVQQTNKTTVRMDERLTDPEQLYGYITECLALVPPHPTVRIHGHHQERRRDKDGKSSTEQVTDFDISFDLQRFLRPAGDARFWGATVVEKGTKVHRGSWRKTADSGFKKTQPIQIEGGEDAEAGRESVQPKKSLRDWCEEYCAHPASLKIFRMNRNVLGLHEEVLKHHIERLIRDTDYMGRIDISFPVDEKHVDIYSPHAVNKWRIGWVRWIFYLTFLWIFTWPVLFFMTKRWDVYNVNWLFSYDVWEGPRDRLEHVVKYATISEVEWFERHKVLIRRMVLMKHQGDSTYAPLHMDDEPTRPVGSGFSVNGNGTLAQAAGIMQAGFSAWNAVSRGQVPRQGWGGDC